MSDDHRPCQMRPPVVCGNNTRCCEVVDNSTVSNCQNTTNEEGQSLPCPEPLVCVCEEGYMFNSSVPDPQNCVPVRPPVVCGNNTRCCEIVDNSTVSNCQNTTNEEGQSLPCPEPLVCVCEEGYMFNSSVPDPQNCVPEMPTCPESITQCPELTRRCPDVQQVMCDGTTYTFNDSYQYVANNLAPLRYSICYSGSNNIIISTCNAADYDTKLALFSCDAMSNIESGGSQTCNIRQGNSAYSNDDFDGCSGFTSLLQIPQGDLSNGTYAIGVYGFGIGGTFKVSISC
ncbi:uncharacterized protein LOC112042606 [Lingula anatina]|uniref:Uncharacterized protein LOC112042606 n=1 Tax=Lingula anatina TaxID=7574 RepID=A0A2R2MSD7_LINAN|nr:uncharacterized protein LOC112042606 [Lingula anatina]|eukprot:XP_023933164.1 uncharacterized protein LOC112042606 [Lingula anatina]